MYYALHVFRMTAEITMHVVYLCFYSLSALFIMICPMQLLYKISNCRVTNSDLYHITSSVVTLTSLFEMLCCKLVQDYRNQKARIQRGEVS